MNPYQILGVAESASDAEVKKAYLKLARKYHPDHYQDNPLADLAQEKMKEINAAYDAVCKMRANGGTSSRTTSHGTRTTWQGPNNGGGSSVFSQVRLAINMGDLHRAEALLNHIQDHGAEWHFLKSALCVRKGWMDEAMQHAQEAVRLDPSNAEYQQMLLQLQQGASYHPQGGGYSTRVCGSSDLCMQCCCSYALCNGCNGFRFCCI